MLYELLKSRMSDSWFDRLSHCLARWLDREALDLLKLNWLLAFHMVVVPVLDHLSEQYLVVMIYHIAHLHLLHKSEALVFGQ